MAAGPAARAARPRGDDAEEGLRELSPRSCGHGLRAHRVAGWVARALRPSARRLGAGRQARGGEVRELSYAKFRVAPAAALSKRKGSAGWVGLETTCVSCHRADDVHRGSLGESCERCHDCKGWKPAPKFDHDSSAFPLTGKHVDVHVRQVPPRAAARHRPRRRRASCIPRFKPLPFKLVLRLSRRSARDADGGPVQRLPHHARLARDRADALRPLGHALPAGRQAPPPCRATPATARTSKSRIRRSRPATRATRPACRPGAAQRQARGLRCLPPRAGLHAVHVHARAARRHALSAHRQARHRDVRVVPHHLGQGDPPDDGVHEVRGLPRRPARRASSRRAPTRGAARRATPTPAGRPAPSRWPRTPGCGCRSTGATRRSSAPPATGSRGPACRRCRSARHRTGRRRWCCRFRRPRARTATWIRTAAATSRVGPCR